jgi:hypothetical protein
MSNDVTVDRDRGRLVVAPRGLNKLWGLVRRIDVPLANVRGATHDPGAAEDDKGLRAPGLAMPGHKWTGTWRKAGARHYWNVTGGADAVVVELRGERFQRLYLSVDDPRSVVDTINAACEGDQAR